MSSSEHVVDALEVIKGQVGAAEQQIIENAIRLTRQRDALLMTCGTVSAMLERNQHNFHRLGALGAQDMASAISILEEAGNAQK